MTFTSIDFQLLAVVIIMVLSILLGCAWLVWKFGPHIDKEELKKNVP